MGGDHLSADGGPFTTPARQLADDSRRLWPSGPTVAECRGLLDRVGVDAGYCSQPHANQTAMPHDCASYLSSGNPRLLELRTCYSEFTCNARHSSQWSPEYVCGDVPLLAFRGDCAYVWQRRDLNTPANFLLTAAHLRNEAADLLQLFEEDGSFGAYTLPYNGRLVSRDVLDSISEILFLDQTIGIRDGTEHRLLDIGSGYGRLAHRMTQACPAVSAVLCADAIPESTFICEYYLRFRECSRTYVIPLPEVEHTVGALSPDVAMSCHCFDECPLSAIEWWVALLGRHSVKYLMIVPAARPFAAHGLVSRERDGERLPIDPLLREHGYRLGFRRPKYRDPSVQRYGVSPTDYLLYCHT